MSEFEHLMVLFALTSQEISISGFQVFVLRYLGVMKIRGSIQNCN